MRLWHPLAVWLPALRSVLFGALAKVFHEEGHFRREMLSCIDERRDSSVLATAMLHPHTAWLGG